MLNAELAIQTELDEALYELLRVWEIWRHRKAETGYVSEYNQVHVSEDDEIGHLLIVR